MSNEHFDLDGEETKAYTPGGNPNMPGGGQATIWQLKTAALMKRKKDFTHPGWYSFEVEVLQTDNPDVIVGKVYKHTFDLPTSVTNKVPRNNALRAFLCALANEPVEGPFKAMPYLTKLCKLSASEELEKEEVYGKTLFTGWRSYSNKEGQSARAANFDFAPVTESDIAA